MTLVPDDVKAEALRLRREGLSLKVVAAQVGISKNTIWAWENPQQAKARRKKKHKTVARQVPNTALREAVQRVTRYEMSRGELCRKIGWTKGHTTNLARALGEVPHQRGNYLPTIAEDLAVRILRAIHVDPWEVGI